MQALRLSAVASHGSASGIVASHAEVLKPS